MPPYKKNPNRETTKLKLMGNILSEKGTNAIIQLFVFQVFVIFSLFTAFLVEGARGEGVGQLEKMKDLLERLR